MICYHIAIDFKTNYKKQHQYIHMDILVVVWQKDSAKYVIKYFSNQSLILSYILLTYVQR
jgi:hypothetical protein